MPPSPATEGLGFRCLVYCWPLRKLEEAWQRSGAQLSPPEGLPVVGRCRGWGMGTRLSGSRISLLLDSGQGALTGACVRPSLQPVPTAVAPRADPGAEAATRI